MYTQIRGGSLGDKSYWAARIREIVSPKLIFQLRIPHHSETTPYPGIIESKN